MTQGNVQLLLSRTREFADDISGVYNQLMHLDGYLARRLYSITGKKMISGGGGERHGCTRPQLTLESVLNTYHPILEALTSYLSTRDLIRFANTSRTLQELLLSHRPAWRYLDFSSPPYSNGRVEGKRRRRIGFNLQNQPVYPEAGFTSELAFELSAKIPLSHLRYLVLDGTDISYMALRIFLNRAKSTLAYVSVRNCGHIQPFGLLEYFSREEVGFPRALKTLKVRSM